MKISLFIYFFFSLNFIEDNNNNTSFSTRRKLFENLSLREKPTTTTQNHKYRTNSFKKIENSNLKQNSTTTVVDNSQQQKNVRFSFRVSKLPNILIKSSNKNLKSNEETNMKKLKSLLGNKYHQQHEQQPQLAPPPAKTTAPPHNQQVMSIISNNTSSGVGSSASSTTSDIGDLQFTDVRIQTSSHKSHEIIFIA